ncbi:hypothetical protein JGI3_00790 [Candidatus Kryptobacter tengchongensis]|uniref:6-bladed beta-propeller protein n=2 Tax=Kryptobacter tengchongensis TaxID=1643429 RepID=A0A656DBC0_KRYT1|nr:6-bladed beta-propeller [Candidatus Kryptobacter tengchongensis]CUT04248.1 hypothetical protein JGI24_01456 [Candidatus Kryptobacter tengchongensis]CUU02724.1 hypothetical protein JGI3_00790 [Candidatus Kryptobacter tengchongensis]
MRFIFVVLILFTACEYVKKLDNKCYESKSENKGCRLYKVGEIKLNENHKKFIGEIMNARVKYKKMFLSDRVSPVVLVINMKGEIEKIIGRKGKGPGEMLEVLSLDVNDGLIYLYDMGNRRFNVFDTSGNFLTSFNLSSNLYGLTYIKARGDKLYLSVIEPKFLNPNEIYKSRNIAVIDTSGNLLALFGERDNIFKKFKSRYFNAVFDFDKLGNIYVAQSGTYRIYKYDDKNNFLKCFGHRGNFNLIDQDIPWDLPIHKTIELILKYSDTWSIHVVDSLIYYQFVNLTIEGITRKDPFYHHYYLKVYDIDGNYIQSDIKLPGEILDIDEEGNIYIYEDNEPGNRRIGIYRLEITTR